MKRVVMSLVAAIGIAVVLGGGIWVAGAVNTASKAMTPTTVVNPQMAAVPNGGVSTGDGSMSHVPDHLSSGAALRTDETTSRIA